MPFMNYQCPYCFSFDVKKDKAGGIVCFECFSILTPSEILDVELNARINDAPPTFPQKLERPHQYAKNTSARRAFTNDRIMRNVIQ
ncbi:MAG: hypothetical protein V1647_07070 [Pseudomonadota bacterium]